MKTLIPVFLLLSACVTAQVADWKPQPREGTLLAEMTFGSLADQDRDKAIELMKDKCGGKYKIEEEGTSLKGGIHLTKDVSVFPTDHYYWLFKCT